MKLLQINKLESIPLNAVVSSLTGLYCFSASNPPNVYDSEQEYFFLYDPYSDTITFASEKSSSVAVEFKNRLIDDFQDSYIYKSYMFLRNPPSSVLSSEGLGGRILVKLQAYILAGISLGLSLYVLLIGYRAVDNFLYGVHKTYMQKKSARYIKSVMDENGGDPLGGSDKSSRSGVDPSIEFPSPR